MRYLGKAIRNLHVLWGQISDEKSVKKGTAMVCVGWQRYQ